MAKGKNYVTKTKEERQAEIDGLLTKSLDAIKNYQSSPEALLEFVGFMSGIHKYSLRNLALIEDQFKGAIAVASFADWKSKGFYVNKGEKGIRILVPTPYQIFKNEKGEWTNLSAATADEKNKVKTGQLESRKKNAYKVGTVFDISQTNAKAEDYPELFPNRVFNFEIQGDHSISQLNESIQAIAKNLNISILKGNTFDGYHLGAARGAYIQSSNGEEMILMNHRNNEVQNITTSIHELAHAHLHNKKILDQHQKNRLEGMGSNEVAEFQAELVSYGVCKNYGIDTSKETIPYVAGWTRNMTNLDPKTMPVVLDGVRNTIKDFIEIMDNSILKQKEVQLEKESDQHQRHSTKEMADVTFNILINYIESRLGLKGDSNSALYEHGDYFFEINKNKKSITYGELQRTQSGIKVQYPKEQLYFENHNYSKVEFMGIHARVDKHMEKFGVSTLNLASDLSERIARIEDRAQNNNENRIKRTLTKSNQIEMQL